MSNELDVVAMLRALAHPVRLGMMRELAERPETCACDFTELFTVSQPTISSHLKVLRKAGLVRTRRRGNQICYSINPQAVRQIELLIAGLTGAHVREIALADWPLNSIAPRSSRVIRPRPPQRSTATPTATAVHERASSPWSPSWSSQSLSRLSASLVILSGTWV